MTLTCCFLHCTFFLLYLNSIKIGLLNPFIHLSKEGAFCVTLLVRCFVTTAPLSWKLCGGEMMYEVTGRKTVKNIISHRRLHSGIFQNGTGGSCLLLPPPSRVISPTTLPPIFDKTRKNDAPHLFKNYTSWPKEEATIIAPKHGDMFVADCPSFVGEKPCSLHACLSFVSRSVSAVSSADTVAARRPSPLPRSPHPLSPALP